MIRLKTEKEIKVLAEGGKILSGILKKLTQAVQPGMETAKLERLARKLINQAGGKPAFLGYKTHGKKYPSALCASVNDAVVHTPAILNYKIKAGDIISLDLGLWYKGLCTDTATTMIVNNWYAKCQAIVSHFAQNKEKRELLDAAKKALMAAIKKCRPGAPISAIGKKVQNIVESAGFNVVRDLVGHGVGYALHEEPMVPNYYDKLFDNIIMEEGLVIAIEPMITTGSGKIELAEDGFTCRTADGAPAAHFEATVAVTKRGPKILTPIV